MSRTTTPRLQGQPGPTMASPSQFNPQKTLYKNIKQMNTSTICHMCKSIPMEKFKKMNDDQIVIDNVKHGPKKYLLKRKALGKLITRDDVPKKIKMLSTNTSFKALPSKVKNDNMTAKCFDNRTMMFSRRNSGQKSNRKFSSCSEDDNPGFLTPDIKTKINRTNTIHDKTSGRKLVKRQSTNRVKFEEFSESQDTFCKNNNAPLPPANSSRNRSMKHRGSFTLLESNKYFLQQTENAKLLNIMNKIKLIQSNNSKVISMRERIDSLFKNTSVDSLKTYVKRMKERIKEIKNMPEEEKEESERKLLERFESQEVKSKNLLNSIIRNRENFSMSDKIELSPQPRKFALITNEFKFSDKRRSTDVISPKQLVTKWTGLKKYNIVGDGIVELLDTGIDAPKPKKYVFDLKKVYAKSPKTNRNHLRQMPIFDFGKS